MSLPKSLLFNHSCMYAKRGDVAAYHIVWIGLCLRSVPGVRVLASAVDGVQNLFFGTLHTSVAFTVIYCRHDLLLQSKPSELQFEFQVKYDKVYTR